MAQSSVLLSKASTFPNMSGWIGDGQRLRGENIKPITCWIDEENSFGLVVLHTKMRELKLKETRIVNTKT